MAQSLLGEYEYSRAEVILAGIRIGDSKDLPTLTKAARILVRQKAPGNRQGPFSCLRSRCILTSGEEGLMRFRTSPATAPLAVAQRLERACHYAGRNHQKPDGKDNGYDHDKYEQ